MPEQRDPFASRQTILSGTAPQLGFPVQVFDQFGLAPPRNQFAFVSESRKEFQFHAEDGGRWGWTNTVQVKKYFWTPEELDQFGQKAGLLTMATNRDHHVRAG